MAHPTEQQLTDLVHVSDDVSDLDTRVSLQFGAEHIAAARLSAVRVKGYKWVFGSQRHPSKRVTHALGVVLGTPPNAVLAIAAAILLLVLLFPPFQLTLPNGMTLHTGFFFILDAEARRGTVNVALLAIECFVVVVVGAITYFLAQRVDRALRTQRAVK